MRFYTNESMKPCTPHINVPGLLVCETPGAGRGIFASQPIPGNTVIEISPVLLFSPEEYSAHGQYTVLDSYTFIWEKRSTGSTMALALGLGTYPTNARVIIQPPS